MPLFSRYAEDSTEKRDLFHKGARWSRGSYHQRGAQRSWLTRAIPGRYDDVARTQTRDKAPRQPRQLLSHATLTYDTSTDEPPTSSVARELGSFAGEGGADYRSENCGVPSRRHGHSRDYTRSPWKPGWYPRDKESGARVESKRWTSVTWSGFFGLLARRSNIINRDIYG